MTRDVTKAFAKAHDAPHFGEVQFVELQFKSGASYVCTREHDIEWNGRTWLGRGKVGSISLLQEAGELEPYGIEMTLGVPATPELMAIALDPSEYKNRKVRIWEGLFGPDLVDFRFTEASLTAEHGADRCTLSVTRAGDTATRVNASGLIEVVPANTPRWDYDPVTLECKGLLIEEARTNICLYSAELDNAAWSPVLGATVTADTDVAPDGTTSADTINFSGSAGNRVEQSTTTVAVDGTTYTYSIWLKGSGTININVGTTTGVGGQTEKTVTLTDELTRHDVTVTFASPSGNVRCMVIWRSGNTATSCVAWGAQLELGAFPTSYIPTTSAAVTRNADVVTCSDVSGFYNATEGTIFVEGRIASAAGVNHAFASFTDGTGNERIQLRAAGGKYVVVDGGSVVAALDATNVVGAVSRAAAAYKEDDFALSFNGAAALTDSAGTLPTVNRLDLGSLAGSSQFLNGHLRRFTYYPVRLGNAVLEELSGGELDPVAAARGRRVVSDPAGPFTFKMDTLRFQLGEQAFLRMTAESRLADWLRPRVRRWNDADHQAEHPGDDFFRDAEAMVEANFVW